MDAVEPQEQKDQRPSRSVLINVNSPGNRISVYDRDCIEINIHHHENGTTPSAENDESSAGLIRSIEREVAPA